MKNYYRLKPFSTIEDMRIKEIIWEKETLKSHNRGLEINIADSPEIFFEKVKLNHRDFFIGPYTLPIISDKLKKILEKLENDLPFMQFIPVKSNIKIDYYVLNLLENIYCFDWDESEYTRYPEFLTELQDRPDEISKLVLVKEKIGKRNIFRMEEQSVHIFISDKLSDILVENDITGIKITKTPNLRQMYDDGALSS